MTTNDTTTGGGATAEATGVPESAAGAERANATIAACRARIDALDAQIIELIEQRMATSAEVQRARLGSGGPRLALSRETRVMERYRERLGRQGAALALGILELCRGAAPRR